MTSIENVCEEHVNSESELSDKLKKLIFFININNTERNKIISVKWNL